MISASTKLSVCAGLNSFASSFFHCTNRALIGVTIVRSTSSTGANATATVSGFSLAIAFGLISPKISTTIVITMVETVVAAD